MILLMGLPGSGKGTQGKLLADTYGWHLISMGDLVRMYVTGERRQQMMAGALLEDSEIISMVDSVLKTVADDTATVLDGFPRTIPQAEWLLEQVKADRFELEAVVYLTVSHEAVLKRLHARGRMDDKDEVIANRFKDYDRLTQPVVDWFKEHNIPVLDVDGERAPEVVNQAIVDQLNLQ